MRWIAAGVAWAGLVLSGCGDADDEATATTTTEAEAAATACPDVEGPDAEQWLRSYCDAFDVPGQIIALQLVPAVSGDNAEPPTGPGWDWSALGEGCEAMAAALPPLEEAALAPPPEYAVVAVKTNEYVQILTEFSDACGPVADDADYVRMKALVPLLDRAAGVATEIEAIFEAGIEPT